MTSPLPPSPLEGSLRLADWGVIRAHGPEAASFLNSQLTQDMLSLTETQARLAGYCSPKGRLLASFVAWRADADTVLLACSADLLAATLKRLSMFVLRAKVKLSDASTELAVRGLAGAAATHALGEHAPPAAWRVGRVGTAQVVRLPDAQGVQRYLWCGPEAAVAPELGPLPPDAWAWLEVQSGVPRLTAATVEQFVPQMVNLEALEGVNFRKGCYPGQEVVARSQYRGTLKRRSFLFEADGPARPGQEVFHSADPAQPAGMVVNAASLDGGHAALVEIKLSALDTGSLHLGAADGPMLRRQQLPYALPQGAD
ncbi:CAF17-like 4Fe-4S cluster assembly/insertion protein YgfZ [Ideonella sp. BN130291]|uniref:CAF17-like 4Fe-4S cluster assembly/insertion protein YgfZ n=1 Tax=Ideonella sp. BN130291 TaxID=3112940 RepID=UPI002E273613|nr:folate-binding protein [Ideonella sp. BN130291]